MAVSWDKSQQQTSLLLWDIDREFQDAYEAYGQWQARHRRTRSKWACFGTKNRDDAVGKALSLGRQIQRLMEQGKEEFGARFEEGDCKSNMIVLYGLKLTPISKMSYHPLRTAPSTSIRTPTATIRQRLCLYTHNAN
jgi:hypothetical protein